MDDEDENDAEIEEGTKCIYQQIEIEHGIFDYYQMSRNYFF